MAYLDVRGFADDMAACNRLPTAQQNECIKLASARAHEAHNASFLPTALTLAVLAIGGIIYALKK